MTYSVESWFLEQEVAKDTLGVWQELVNLMAELCDTPAGFIVQMTEHGYQVVIANQSKDNPYPAGGIIPSETNIFCRKVVEENRAIYVPNATELSEWKSNPEVTDDGYNSYLGFPLCWPSGKVFGTICVMDLNITNYDDRYHRLIQHFKKMAERELELLDQNIHIENISIHDEQTKLLNRRGFKILAPERLQLAHRHQDDVIVCYFDLDGLKHINDHYGHDIGDDVLLAFSQALKDSLRNTDVVARFGGDEFVAVIFMKHIDELNLVNKRLNASLKKYINNNIEIKFSIGAIVVSHDKLLDIDIEEIISQADKRMYINKKSKR